MPLITDDTGFPLFNLFNTESLLPSTVFIDHTMTIFYQEAGWNSSVATSKVNQMLDNLENSLILAPSYNTSIIGDSDDILNPGEEFEIEFTISNNSFYLFAENVQASIAGNSDVVFNQNNLLFGNIDVDGNSSVILTGYVNDDVFLGTNDFVLDISADYTDLNDGSNTYNLSYNFEINVLLNQSGFPFDSNSEVKPSPLVVDFTNNGENEVIFGDNNGLVHVIDIYGNELVDGTFPYNTGDQIWGSLASGYIDADDKLDIAITSKSKHLYILDIDGLKLDYNANKFLVGNPVLGNLDDDEDLEIVFGSFSSSPKLYAVNIDGSDVEGFPLDLEKTYTGVALADFNGNGKDDIVIGTEQDEVYLIYDDATVAPGFPFEALDKIRSAPSIVDTGSSLLILACSTDEHIYGINDDGSLRFSFQADDELYTSPSFLESSQGLMIFFGSESGTLYSIDINGNLHNGYPLGNDESNSFGGIVGSVVFEDLDSDGVAEIIFGDENGYLHILKSMDDSYSTFNTYNSFPAQNTFAYASSASIEDVDMDGDLEVIAGTTGDVAIYDIKETSSLGGFWNLYRGNYHRTGFYQPGNQCVAGDINLDNILNVLDIVTLVNIVINSPEITNEEECAADLNSDGVINVLDIVTLVNIIISS